MKELKKITGKVKGTVFNIDGHKSEHADISETVVLQEVINDLVEAVQELQFVLKLHIDQPLAKEPSYTITELRKKWGSWLWYLRSARTEEEAERIQNTAFPDWLKKQS